MLGPSARAAERVPSPGWPLCKRRVEVQWEKREQDKVDVEKEKGEDDYVEDSIRKGVEIHR